MNSLLASPVVQLLARVIAVLIVVMVQWSSGNPDRFIAHVKGRVERQEQSLREAVRQTLAMRMMQLGAPLLFLMSPELYGSVVQGVALVAFSLALVAGGMLPRSSRPPIILKRRWMDDFDQWWNHPGMAIQGRRAPDDAEQ